jgi:predicted transcriptional regulator
VFDNVSLSLYANDVKLYYTGKVLKEIDHRKTGQEARRSREAVQVSLRKMATKMGISASYLSELENGKRNWRENLVEQFRDALLQNES